MSKRGNQDEHEKRTEMPDEEMGEFEDMWEDEFASDEEAIASASEAEAEEEVEMEVEKDTYLPGQAIAEDEVLIADLSVYEMLHSMNMEWPCLSFDFLHDGLGQDRRSVRPPTLFP
jgi:ribosome assembly protein RRB1